MSYFEKKIAGEKVVIIGGGGIAFDVALFLINQGKVSKQNLREQSIDDFTQEWGIDFSLKNPGGITKNKIVRSNRQINILQRRFRKPGAGLGRTTGWILKEQLSNQSVKMNVGVKYEKIDNAGLHISIRGKHKLIEADHIINCSGQIENNSLADKILDKPCHLIGGSSKALGLDAERAILEAALLAQTI